MSQPDSNQPRNNFEEDEIDLEFVKKFIAEMLDDKNNFKSENPKISRILESLPKKLQEYLLELQRLEKEKKSEEKQDSNAQDRKNRLDKDKKIDERIKQITKEIFIISCASNKPLEESLKFHAACKLSVEDLSKFGECGLSPLMATMLSGKSDADLKKLINLGANVNEKNAYGFTVLDFAELVGSKATTFLKENGAKGLNSNQKEEDQQREKDDKKESKKAKNSDEKLEQKTLAREEAERARMQQEQLMIAQSMLALQLYQEMIEQKKQQQEVIVKSKQESLEQIKAKEVTEKNAANANEASSKSISNQQSDKENTKPSKASKSETELAIEKIIGVDLKEANINKLLFNAVNAGQSMLAILLVHCGADVNYREGSRSVLDMAVEKGSSSLISVLSSVSSPETVSSAFRKVVNNGNYSAQTFEALTGQKIESQNNSVSTKESSLERVSNTEIVKADNVKAVKAVIDQKLELQNDSVAASSIKDSKDNLRSRSIVSDENLNPNNSKKDEQKSRINIPQRSAPESKKLPPEKPSSSVIPKEVSNVSGKSILNKNKNGSIVDKTATEKTRVTNLR